MWIAGAVFLSVASFVGGDTAILSGWLYLVWTAPFGLIWWFYLYNHALVLLPANIAQPVGVVLVDVVAFFFWFRTIPWLRRLSKRRVMG
ncbi:MAG TPA: hypothetical protein VKA19_09140 [Alphaproteobacteria bacterium]|nr:hypothetical protein [Alphaproteobacteria bacterium]